ncbi:MAG TPA: hypothetical protein VGO34_14940 [Alphaproteobacteria bacterium]|jgi:hypothetical protein
MAKAILSWLNHVDRPATVLTASQQAGSLSISNVADPIIGRRWRTTDLAAWGQADFGADLSVGVLLLRFPRDTAFPLAGAVTHAFDADGGTPGAGAAFSSGPVAIGTADGYGYHVYLPPAPVVARYWRWTFAVSGVAFVDVGRAWAGEAWTPAINISYGWGDEWQDLSRVSESARSGAEFADEIARRRVLSFGLDSLTDADRQAVREMQRIVGISKQMVFLRDPSAPAAESILGRMAGSTPILHQSLPIFSKAFVIRESL